MINIIRKILHLVYRIILKIIGKCYQLFYLETKDLFFAIKIYFKLNKYIEYEGNHNLGDKICIFASFPFGGKISKLLLHYIKSIQELGYSIIFVSNKEIIEGLEELKPLCSKIIIRDNIGRDFGSYKTGLIKFEQEIRNCSELLIANDSVVGPISDLKVIFEEMREKKLDFWGLTEADCAPSYHITSYFVVFNKSVITSQPFWQFWKNYKFKSSRAYSIYQGEINLTYTLLKNSFTCGAYIDKFKIFKFINHIIKEDDYSPVIYLLSTNYKRHLFTNIKSYFEGIDHLNTNLNKYCTQLIMDDITLALDRENHYSVSFLIFLELKIPIIKKDVIRSKLTSECLIYEFIKKYSILNVDEVMYELKKSKAYNNLWFRVKRSVAEA